MSELLVFINLILIIVFCYLK